MSIFKTFKGINFFNINCNSSFMIGIIIGLSTMYLLIEFKKNCWIFSDTKMMRNKIILKLIRQTARWSTAALQDKSPVIAVLHANYGAGYLWALKDIVSTSEIESVTNIDMQKFEENVINIQDTTTKKLAHLCPQYAKTDNKYLAQIAGESS